MDWRNIQEVTLTELGCGLNLGAKEGRSVKVDSQVSRVDFAEKIMNLFFGPDLYYILDNFKLSKQKHQEDNGIYKVRCE